MSEYVIYIRNKDGLFTSRLTDIISVSIAETLNEVGSWSISSKTAEICPFKSGDGIVVYRNGSYYYSGVAKKITEKYDGYEGTYTWTASGVSDLEYLNRRLVYPDPATGATDVLGHYEDSGTLGAVVARMIDKNLGTLAMMDRAEPVIGAVDIQDAGDPVSVSLRFQVLFTAVMALLNAQKYTMRTVWDANAQKLTYQIVSGKDLTDTMVFSTAMGTGVISSNFSADVPRGNFIISAGEGEMTERAFAYASDAQNIAKWGRIEAYRDMRATADDDLQTDADVTLQTYSEMSIGYSADLIADSGLLYKTDWNLGDYVSIVVRGQIMALRVNQVMTTISYDRETVKMTVGTVDRGTMMRIFNKLDALSSDVDQLQRVSD